MFGNSTKQFARIALEAKGHVGAAAVVIETGEAAFLNADEHYPMQSVYKLPIAMATNHAMRLPKRSPMDAMTIPISAHSCARSYHSAAS